MLFSSKSDHPWKFFRSGGFDQVRLDTADDLMNLNQLDQKLWAVLSCPVSGLRLDKKTLSLIDTDQDGRIRVPEIIAAVHWAGSLLKNPADLTKASPRLPLSSIRDESPEGQEILASARQILTYLGKPDQVDISPEETGNLEKILSGTPFNGDGVITRLSAETDEEKSLISLIQSILGSVPDRSGEPGLNEELIAGFFNQLADLTAWRETAVSNPKEILPLGDQTEQAVEAFSSVRQKIDDYFTRCQISTYNPAGETALNSSPEALAGLAGRMLSVSDADLAALPLAAPGADRELPLTEGLNPAWEARMAGFRKWVAEPLSGRKKKLSQDDWQAICKTLAPFEAWQAARPVTAVESVSAELAKTLLGGSAKNSLTALIQRDLALAREADSIVKVDKLVRFHRDLFVLLNNFVSFRDFYTKRDKAIFQAGELYLDGRCCELCIEVEDAAKHSALANLSGTYLAYCQVIRRGTGEKKLIAAAFTNGGTENLMVGRNGIFYDRDGNDWDASIVKILDHPISIRQAFFAPYQRLARMISQQLEKFAAAKDKAVEQKHSEHVSTAAGKVDALPQQPLQPVPQPPPAPFDVGKFAGIFAAVGLAIGAIGGVLATIFAGIMGLHWWQMPLAFAGLILAVSGPSMLMAWLKLRLRNLSPILDANGWAVNTQAKINIPFGRSLTQIAKLPEGAERSLQDPYAEKKRPWKLYGFLAFLLFIALYLWDQGYIQHWIGLEPPAPAVSAPEK